MENKRSTPVFICREEELKTLNQSYQWVIENRKPHLVFVHGDYGVGKTSFVDHFLQTVCQQENKPLIGKGRCSFEDKENGKIPFIHIINALIQQEGGLKIKQNVGRGARWLWEVVPGWMDVIGFGIPGAVTNTVDATVRLLKPENKTIFGDEQIFMQFTNLVAKLAKKRNTILFIDDLQWADETSMRLLYHLLNHLTEVPVLVIVAYRTVDIQQSTHAKLFGEIRSALMSKKLCSEIILETGINVHLYAQTRYRPNDFSPALIELIQGKSDGLAFYVSELFSLWEQKEIIAYSKTTDVSSPVWHVVGNAELEVPSGLEEIIRQRIKSLKDNLRDIIAAASVEGEDFTAQLIEKLYKIDQLVLYDDLQSLHENYNLINEQGERQVSSVLFDFYRFTHRFIREYVYNKEIPNGKRRQLHRKAGECLETICADHRPIAGQLARHFREAHEDGKAVSYMLLAAQYEQAHYSWAECQNWCKQGLVLLEKTAIENDRLIKIEFLDVLADSYYYSARYEESAGTLEAAVELGLSLGVPAERIVKFCVDAADSYEYLEEFKKAIQILEKARQIAIQNSLPLCEAEIGLRAMMGLLMVRSGKRKEAISMIEKTIEDARSLEQTEFLKKAIANAYVSMGIAYSNMGQYKQSVPLFQKAIELVQEIGDIALEVTFFIDAVEDRFWIEEFSSLVPGINRAQNMARQIGDTDGEAHLYTVLGTIYLEEGKYKAAEVNLKKGIELWHRLGIDQLSSPLSDLALTYLGQGNREQALVEARKALQIARHANAKGYTLDTLATVEASLGKKEAYQHFEKAIEILEHENSEHLVACAQRHYAEALIAAGNTSKATGLLVKSLNTFQKLEIPREIQRIEKLLLGLL